MSTLLPPIGSSSSSQEGGYAVFLSPHLSSQSQPHDGNSLEDPYGGADYEGAYDDVITSSRVSGSSQPIASSTAPNAHPTAAALTADATASTRHPSYKLFLSPRGSDPHYATATDHDVSGTDGADLERTAGSDDTVCRVLLDENLYVVDVHEDTAV
jgi:hypothetical protein